MHFILYENPCCFHIQAHKTHNPQTATYSSFNHKIQQIQPLLGATLFIVYMHACGYAARACGRSYTAQYPALLRNSSTHTLKKKNMKYSNSFKLDVKPLYLPMSTITLYAKIYLGIPSLWQRAHIF